MKLQRQWRRHGVSIVGMPPIEVRRDLDGKLVIYDGVTRATRVAKFAAGTLVPVVVMGNLRGRVGDLPKVGDRL